jgi:hypothetical protein
MEAVFGFRKFCLIPIAAFLKTMRWCPVMLTETRANIKVLEENLKMFIFQNLCSSLAGNVGSL